MRQSFLLRIIRAAITPGIQPNKVRINTIRNEPQPLSITAKGGKRMANKTRRTDIIIILRVLVTLYV